MAEKPRRPLPTLLEPDTQPFWEATKNHELRYQVCDDCNKIVFYPRRHCPHCMGLNLRWKTSQGEGSVYTYTVIRQIAHPAFRERAPYIIAWIDLDEGFRMLSTIVGDEITIGQRVRVTWDDQENDISLPLFSPV